jgi:hypothetical protein
MPRNRPRSQPRAFSPCRAYLAIVHTFVNPGIESQILRIIVVKIRERIQQRQIRAKLSRSVEVISFVRHHSCQGFSFSLRARQGGLAPERSEVPVPLVLPGVTRSASEMGTGTSRVHSEPVPISEADRERNNPASLAGRPTMLIDRRESILYSSLGFNAIACAYLFASPIEFVLAPGVQGSSSNEGSLRPFPLRERLTDARSRLDAHSWASFGQF